MFKNLKKTDYVIIILVFLALIASVVFFFFSKSKISNLPIESEKTVVFQTFFRGITITSQNSPFVTGEDSFITIRNVPYTKLKIVDVKYDRRKVVVPVNTKEKFMLVDDFSSPFQYDFLVSLTDKAKITDDGAVVGGNKLKIGVPIVLEGKSYKLNGVISDIQVVDDDKIIAGEQDKK